MWPRVLWYTLGLPRHAMRRIRARRRLEGNLGLVGEDLTLDCGSEVPALHGSHATNEPTWQAVDTGECPLDSGPVGGQRGAAEYHFAENGGDQVDWDRQPGITTGRNAWKQGISTRC